MAKIPRSQIRFPENEGGLLEGATASLISLDSRGDNYNNFKIDKSDPKLKLKLKGRSQSRPAPICFFAKKQIGAGRD